MNPVPVLGGSFTDQQFYNALENRDLYTEEICEILGHNCTLFLEYCDTIEEMLERIMRQESAVDGYLRGLELYNVCWSIVCNSDDQIGHPFFKTALLYISAHPLLAGDAVTRACAYYVALYNEFINAACATHIANAERAANEIMPQAELSELRKTVVGYLGEHAHLLDSYEQATQRLEHPMPLFHAFLDDAAKRLAQALNHRDAKTSMSVYQVLVEHGLLRLEGVKGIWRS